MDRRFILSVTMALAGVCVSASAGALHQAVRARDIFTLQALLESHAGSALDTVIGGGITALHLAAATDAPDMVGMLIERGAAVNASNDAGFTPLHWASSRNAVSAMRELLAADANINARASSNITPLHWAAARNATAAVALLIAAGADLTAVTTLGYTPLHLAVKENPYSETAVILAQARVVFEKRSGQAGPDELLPLPDPETADFPAGPSDLPDRPRDEPVLLPGMFLMVPIGLGDSLNFVWLENVGIWFGKYEITNARYRRFHPAHSSRSIEGHTLNAPEQPVVYVSWHDAMEYCAWLNQTFADRIPEGFEFRLPSEFEWMIAAGSGDTRIYPWGDQWPPLYGNFPDMTARSHLSQWRGFTGYDDGFAVTAPVESSGMNELGIYGLAGNVWEWTMDALDADHPEFRIRKGGSWDFDEQDSLRIAARGFDRPDARYDSIGFRVVVAPIPPPAPPIDVKRRRR